MNVQTATTAELVAFYNAHAEKPVKRFSDRKTAELRVTALMVRVAAQRKPYGSAPSAGRSEAIAESWKDPAVAAARAKRHKVYADGQLYKSVPEAFRALKLPMNKHIAFRGALRDAGALVFKHGDREVKFELAAQE